MTEEVLTNVPLVFPRDPAQVRGWKWSWNPDRLFRRLTALFVLGSLPAFMLYHHNRQQRTLVPQPRGMVLGLYAGLPDYDYHQELKRIKAHGAHCVSIQAIYRMEDRRSTTLVRHPTSSPTDASLRRTFRQARELGLRVMFFPTINMTHESGDNWRGTIEPSDWNAWWSNYKAFNLHYARMAQECGVEWYSLGTEMVTTHRFPDQWRSMIRDLRKVYRGKFTYSVNFDAHDSFDFGDALDVIGMNTYDPIAKDSAYPSPDRIRDEWWWIVTKARTLQARFAKPVMITEVGYPSVAMAHAGPWDFRTDKEADPDLQNVLLKGALGVLRNWSEGAAVFVYLYGENLATTQVGGLQDRTYAIWGKPAEDTVRHYYSEPVWEGRIPVTWEEAHESLLQTLVSQEKKLAQFEDFTMPEWALDWRQRHPHDAAEANRRFKRLYPHPLPRVPKGQEHPS